MIPMNVIGRSNVYVKIALPVDTLYLFRSNKDIWEFSIEKCDAFLNKEYNNPACSLRTRACLYGPCEIYNNAQVYDFRKCFRHYRKDISEDLITGVESMCI
jgi:hypothetical protein